MKDRFNRAKQYVIDHKKTIVGAGAGATVGVIIGKKLNIHQHTILTITPNELETLLDDTNNVASYAIAKRKTISLLKVPSRSS